MNSTGTKRLQRRLREEMRDFPWKSALPRMAADVALVNLSMVSAFIAWFLFYVLFLQVPEPKELARVFQKFVATYWLLWSFLALLVFHLHGFYTRARGYASRYKAWTVIRAASLFIVMFVFADYFLFRSSLIPRGVAVLGWVFTLLAVGGARFGKEYVLRRYRVEPKRRPKKIERVLVVGGAGYLGSHIVPQLLERGYRARVLDLFLFGEESLATVKYNPYCELVYGDVRDIKAIVEAMRGCDAVIDLAAIVGDPACNENKPLAIEINRAATRLLVDIARGYGAARFLFASTCSVYGATDLLSDERSRVAPLSTYAQTKLDSESILLEAASKEFQPTIFRLGTLFGFSPRMRSDLVVNLLVLRAALEGKVSIFNGHQWRPFVHVQDAARGFVESLEAKTAVVAGEIYNLGDDRLNCQLSEVGQALAAMIPGVELDRVENGADARSYRVSFQKIRAQLGFTCRVSLAEGMQEVYDAIRSGRIPDVGALKSDNLAVVRAYSSASSKENSPLRKLVALAGKD